MLWPILQRYSQDRVIPVMHIPNRRRLWTTVCLVLMISPACERSDHGRFHSNKPLAGVEVAPLHLLSYGLAVGDVSEQSAVIWVKTNGPAKGTVDYWSESTTTPQDNPPHPVDPVQEHRISFQTEADHDFVKHVALAGLSPATRYTVRIRASNEPAPSPDSRIASAPAGEELLGGFKTLAASHAQDPVTFGWSADVGGQTRCRRDGPGYAVFDVARSQRLDFFLLLGDTVYADESCPAPPNAPGSDFKAATLEEYRAKHRYQRGSSALQQFLALVPVYAVWDDHEVQNNFAGPYEPRMPIGRQAFFEYWPIRTAPDDPHRLYRSFRAGAAVEIFILDTRQYRSRNSQPDGPSKSMLGSAQLKWLLAALEHSSATWKVIASSVPLSVPKGGPPYEPGNDGWAGGSDGTGFETELKVIVDHIMARRISNVVWLTGDVHFVEANAYDADGDGTHDFHEFVAGPLAAATKGPMAVKSPFAVRTLVAEGGYLNFGKVRVDVSTLDVTILDDAGTVRFTHRLLAQ
ncbi:MAG: alkaline phosphatase [Nitrospiraceae bacterium]